MKIVAVVQETDVFTASHGGVETCSSTVVYATNEAGALFRHWIDGQEKWHRVELPPLPEPERSK